jgi:hypothetical protein
LAILAPKFCIGFLSVMPRVISKLQ